MPSRPGSRRRRVVRLASVHPRQQRPLRRSAELCHQNEMGARDSGRRRPPPERRQPGRGRRERARRTGEGVERLGGGGPDRLAGGPGIHDLPRTDPIWSSCGGIGRMTALQILNVLPSIVPKADGGQTSEGSIGGSSSQSSFRRSVDRGGGDLCSGVRRQLGGHGGPLDHGASGVHEVSGVHGLRRRRDGLAVGHWAAPDARGIAPGRGR
jgi:hypothetical protein